MLGRPFWGSGSSVCSTVSHSKSGADNSCGTFTYVDDCVEALIACLHTPETCGKVYNLGGCEPVNLIQLADALVEAAGQGEYSIKEFPADRKKIDIGDYYSADKAFRDATGWKHRDVPPQCFEANRRLLSLTHGGL